MCCLTYYHNFPLNAVYFYGVQLDDRIFLAMVCALYITMMKSLKVVEMTGYSVSVEGDCVEEVATDSEGVDKYSVLLSLFLLLYRI